MIEGNYEPPLTLVAFLYVLYVKFRAGWETISISEKIDKKYRELVKEYGEDEPGFLNGRHFSTYPGDVIELEKQGNVDEAINLLNQLVTITEKNYQFMHDTLGGGVAPWYYERLAIIYRKQKDIDSEIQILERFSCQKHASGVSPKRLLERLETAKEIKKSKEKSKEILLK